MIMKKEFDFTKVGKKMPYTVPEGFFEKIEDNIHATIVFDRNVAKKQRYLRIVAASIVSIAAVVALCFIIPNKLDKSNNDYLLVERAFSLLNNDEQIFLIQVYQEDLFIND